MFGLKVSMASKAQYIRGKFNSVWSSELRGGGELKKELRLVCSDDETVYLTHPKDALEIQREIANHTEKVEVVLDAFACVGGDSLAAMYVHREAHVHAVQRVTTIEEKERFERLATNLKQFRGTVRRSGKVLWYQSDIGSFLMKFDSDISLLYLDPPWALGEDPKVISSSESIRVFLKHNVFDFLRTKQSPRLICFKLPYKVDDIEEWPCLSMSYRHVKWIPMRQGKYHVHILHVIE